jgi:hypothetical protein
MCLDPEKCSASHGARKPSFDYRLLRPEENTRHFANLMDMQMLVMTPGGRERSLSEFQDLLAEADLALARTVTVPMGQSVLECRAA